MSDEEIRTLLDDAGEAQWAALPPEYHADSAQSRTYKVVTRRDAMPDQEITDWLKRNDGCRVVGAPPQSLTGRSAATPVFYVVPRSVLTP